MRFLEYSVFFGLSVCMTILADQVFELSSIMIAVAWAMFAFILMGNAYARNVARDRYDDVVKRYQETLDNLIRTSKDLRTSEEDVERLEAVIKEQDKVISDPRALAKRYNEEKHPHRIVFRKRPTAEIRKINAARKKKKAA